tara:strand:- start:68 stop:619 length:552 start_codon:yes stop_codon:yes gene_type:complete
MEWILGTSCIVFLGVWFFRHSKNKTPGDKSDLKEIFDHVENDLTVVKDVDVPVQGGMGQIDFVAVSSYEVFVISVVKTKGKIRGDINSMEWQAGKKTIYNPVWRNRLLLNGLETVLKEVRLTPLVIFLNGVLVDDFGENIIELKSLKSFFKKREKIKIPDSAIIESTIKTLKQLKGLERKNDH